MQRQHALALRRLGLVSPRAPQKGAYSRVHAVVSRIPRGRVATYGEVARRAGYANAPRVAGYALHALPEGTPVPWHRVLGAGGRLSLARLDPDAALTQRMRLEREGVRFDARGRVDLKRYGWHATVGVTRAVRRPARGARPPAATARRR